MIRAVRFWRDTSALSPTSFRRAARTQCSTTLDPASISILDDYKGHAFPWRIIHEVEFRDCDAFRHVNNAVYFTYFETARCKLWDSLGLPLITTPGGSDIGPILSSTSCVYKGSLAWPDRLVIGIRVSDLQRDRGQFVQHYAVYSETSGRIAAVGQAEIVLVHMTGADAGKRASIPQSWVTAFFPEADTVAE